jgi:hypothetical protein
MPAGWHGFQRPTKLDSCKLVGPCVPALCCFERVGPGQWCHRAIAAQWLADALGILVPEVGFEAAPVHPLLPLETLV